MANYTNNARTGTFNITHLLVRLAVGALVLGITAALTPGFGIANIWSLALATIVLAVLDYLVTRLFRIDASPFGRGIVGFILAAVIIYITQYFVAGYAVTFWGALLGALIYGLIDLVIPGKAM